jgi:hypothetical protein
MEQQTLTKVEPVVWGQATLTSCGNSYALRAVNRRRLMMFLDHNVSAVHRHRKKYITRTRRERMLYKLLKMLTLRKGIRGDEPWILSLRIKD